MADITLETVIQTIKGWVENNQTIQPSQYLDEAVKLNVLLEELDTKIADKRMELEKLERQQKRIVEHIRLSKKYSDLKSYQ